MLVRPHPSRGPRFARRVLPGVAALLIVQGLLVLHPAFAGTSTVTTNADSGAGSLRAAITASGSGDTITFAPSLSGQTITLTSGELAITHDLTITGPGASSLSVSGNDTSRVFDVTNGSVAISGLTVTHGHTVDKSGGGIELVAGSLTLTNVVVTNSVASGNQVGGGGIDDAGTLTIVNSTVSNNSATDSSPTGHQPFGGGISVCCGSGSIVPSFVMTNSTVSGNTSVGTTSQIGSNLTATGGGIAMCCDVTGEISHSTISGNSLTGYQSFGGGIAFCCGGATLSVDSALISGNTVTGPGINGGGIAVCCDQGTTFTMTSGTISGNSLDGSGSGVGAGVYLCCLFTRSLIENTTIIGNQSTGDAGGLEADGCSGCGTTPVSLIDDTIANNTAPSGSSGQLVADAGAVVTATGTIVSGSGKSCGVSGGGAIRSGGYSLDSGSTCGFGSSTHDVVGKDPKLGPLGAHGGPVPTAPLLPGSPAIDAGPHAPCPVSADARGVHRPQGKACDIGAFELTPPAKKLTVSVTGQGSVSSKPAGVHCPGSCAHSFAQGTAVTLTPHPAPGWRLASWGGACHGTGSCSVRMSNAEAVHATFARRGKQSRALSD